MQPMVVATEGQKPTAPAAPAWGPAALVVVLALVVAKIRAAAAWCGSALVPTPGAAPAGAYPAGSMRAALAEERANVAKEAQQLIAGGILLAIAFVIGLIMYPIASQQAADAAADNNTQERDIPLILLLPTLLIVLLALGGVGMMFLGFKGLANN